MPLVWEMVEFTEAPPRWGLFGVFAGLPIMRARVPGGWFVSIGAKGGFFYPDPDHKWDPNAGQPAPSTPTAGA